MNNQKQKGSVLIYVVILLVVGIMLTTTIFIRNLNQYRTALLDKKITTASHFANSAVTDIMRQFSQTQYGDHYSALALDRSASSLGTGYSEASITPNETEHTLYINATGKYGKDVNNPDNTQRLTAVIKFLSDITSFGTYINNSFTTSGGDVDYNGKFWINGDYRITGSNVVFNGGPVFVNGDISEGAGVNPIINGDLYYAGSKSGNIVVNGNTYNYCPMTEFPVLDTDYYEAHYHYKYTSSDHTGNSDTSYSGGSYDFVQLTFNSNGTFTVAGGPTETIPSNGCIIYGENCNIRVTGTIHGRVTVVAKRIKIRNDILYANGTNNASADDSFAALATDRMYFISTSGTMDIHGAFFLADDSENFQGDTTSSRDLNLYGTRNNGLTSDFGDVVFENDPYLDKFPPPGLPEKAYIVSWNLK